MTSFRSCTEVKPKARPLGCERGFLLTTLIMVSIHLRLVTAYRYPNLLAAKKLGGTYPLERRRG